VTPNILDCVAERWFWVTWVNSTVLVGYGNDPGKDVFMVYRLSYSLPDTLSQLWVSSAGYDDANWTIPYEYYPCKMSRSFHIIKKNLKYYNSANNEETLLFCKFLLPRFLKEYYI